jgi:hypothetical protein
LPSYHEVRHYIGGIWLLIRGDMQGFHLLDISDRGMLRSFWAALWCLPAMFVIWNWIRLSFLVMSPPGTKAGLPFFMRLALVEAINWIVPLVLIAAICLFLDFGRKFPVIVVTMNWLSVPLAYANAALALGALFLPAAANIFVILQMVLLFVSATVTSRILRLICGSQPLIITTMVMVLFVPGFLLAEALQEYLGLVSY